MLRSPTEPQNRYARVIQDAGASARQHWKMFAAGAVLLVLTLYAYEFVAGDEGLLKMQALKSETATLQARNNDLKREKAALSAQSETLKLNKVESNPFLLEKLVRENRLLVRPGEILYTFDEAGTATTPEGLPAVTIAQRPPKKAKTDAPY